MRWSHGRGRDEVICQEKSRQMRMEEVDRKAGRVGEKEKGEMCSVGKRCED
jgi:hypothetical protein